MIGGRGPDAVLGTVVIIELSTHWGSRQAGAHPFARKLERECVAVDNQQFEAALRRLPGTLNRNIGEKRIHDLLHLVHAQVISVCSNATADPPFT